MRELKLSFSFKNLVGELYLNLEFSTTSFISFLSRFSLFPNSFNLSISSKVVSLSNLTKEIFPSKDILLIELFSLVLKLFFS